MKLIFVLYERFKNLVTKQKENTVCTRKAETKSGFPQKRLLSSIELNVIRFYSTHLTNRATIEKYKWSQDLINNPLEKLFV